MSRTPPWYRWFPGDFLRIARGWSLAQRGAFQAALDAQWDLDGLPADLEELRAAINATAEEWRHVWPKLEQHFPVAADGKRRRADLESERAQAATLTAARSAGGKRGAAKRWQHDGPPNGSPNVSPNGTAYAGHGHGHNHSQSQSHSQRARTPAPTSEVRGAGPEARTHSGVNGRVQKTLRIVANPPPPPVNVRPEDLRAIEAVMAGRYAVKSAAGVAAMLPRLAREVVDAGFQHVRQKRAAENARTRAYRAAAKARR